MQVRFFVEGYGAGGAAARIDLSSWDLSHPPYLHFAVVERVSGQMLLRQSIRLLADRSCIRVIIGDRVDSGLDSDGLLVLFPEHADIGFAVETTDSTEGTLRELHGGLFWQGTRLVEGSPAESIPADFYRYFPSDPDSRVVAADNVYEPVPAEIDDSAREVDVNVSDQVLDVDSAIPPRRIDRVTLVGLRGFASSQHVDLAIPDGKRGSGLTLVVGPNNSGKSTVWEALEAVSRHQQGEVTFPMTRRNESSLEGVRISLEYSNQDALTLESSGRDTNQMRSLWKGRQIHKESAAELDIVTVPARRQFNPYFGRYANDDRRWRTHDGDFTRTGMREGISARLISIHNDPDEKSLLDNLLERIVGSPLAWSIDSTESQNGETFFLKFRNAAGSSHSSDGLGEGLLSLLFIAVALHDSGPDSLIALDEPELSLHPQLVRRLKSILGEYAKDRQIVLCTHSPILVDWDYIADGARIARVVQSEVGSEIHQPSVETLSSVARLRASRTWRAPHTLGLNANEIFFLDDKVVLTEGPEDVALLPKVASSVEEEIDWNLFGWGAGGANNIPHLLRLLSEIGMLQVAAILDADKEEIAETLQEEYGGYLVRNIPADDIRTKRSEPRVEKIGLLDEGYNVREEYRDDTRTLVRDINAYFASGSTAQG